MDEERSMLLQALIDTRTSANRTLVALSASGIGLLITLASLLDQPAILTMVLLGIATLGFLVGILVGMGIMHLDSVYLEEALRLGPEASGSRTERLIRACRYGLWAFFVIGVLFSVAGTLAHTLPPLIAEFRDTLTDTVSVSFNGALTPGAPVVGGR